VRLGQCSVCFEMTTVEDLCCPMAGVLIDGEYTNRSEQRILEMIQFKTLSVEKKKELLRLRLEDFRCFLLDALDEDTGTLSFLDVDQLLLLAMKVYLGVEEK
jgi:hypothetical protein